MEVQVSIKTTKTSTTCSCTWSCSFKPAGHYYWLSSDSHWSVPVVPRTHLRHQIYLGEPGRNWATWPDSEWFLKANSRDKRKPCLYLVWKWTAG